MKRFTHNAGKAMSRRLKPIAVFIGCLLLPATMGAYAEEQSVTPNEQKKPVNAEDGQLEVIQVTAQRRVENVQDVPIAISVVSADKLGVYSSSGDDIKALSAKVPSLVAESSVGRTYPRFYIRGYGNTDFSVNASQPVELVVDDVVQSNANLKAFPLFDVERIEVLKGPQGTLFGRNTPAGVIKVDTRKPSEDFNGYIDTSLGRFGQVNVQGAVGGALVEGKLSGRVSLISENRNDFINNRYTGEDDALGGYKDDAARVQLLWTPTDSTNVLLNYHHRKLDGTSTIFYANALSHGKRGVSSDFDRYNVYEDGKNASRLTQDGGSVKVDVNLGEHTITSVSAYEHVKLFTRGDVDGGYNCPSCAGDEKGVTPFPVETAGDNDVKQYTQELRIASNDWEGFNYQSGIFYFYEDLTSDENTYDTLNNSVLTGIDRLTQTNHTLGIFSSVTVDITDDWSVRGGVRYSKDKKDFHARGVMPVVSGTSDSTDADQVSWDLATSYALTDDVKLYSRIAKGFRAPSIQGRADYITTVDSEKMISAEAGVKSTLWDGKARFDFDVYHYRVKGQQLTAVGGDSNVTRLLNADKTVGKGVETNIEVAASRALTLTLAGSYNHTEIKDKDLRVAYCGANCTVTDPIVGNGLASIDGNPLPQAPKWIGAATARYSYPLDSGELYAFTDWSYKSKTNLFLYSSKEFTADPSLEGGLRLGYLSDSGYEVALWCRNITDEETVTGALDFNNLAAIMNQPRTYGIEFKASFF